MSGRVISLAVFIFGACHVHGVFAESPAELAARRLPLPVCQAEWGEEQILCGSYEVFENRSTKAGRKIALNIIIIPSLSENPEPDPIFDIDGGPGVPSTNTAEWYATSPFRNNRDIVLVDLRGMGGSNPLHCDLIGDRRNLQNYIQEMYPPELLKSCREELEKRADLTQYHTSIAMEDIEEVRAWLGYERINIFALSYGGRAAYVYARAYPERVRSMILTGPADINTRMPMFHAPMAEKAFIRLCADCAVDSSCNKAFPDLELKLRELVERLRKIPAEVDYKHPLIESPFKLLIRAEIFVEAMRSALYTTWSRREVPWIIYHAYEGDFVPFLDWVIPKEFDSPPFLAEGAYLSYTGAEDAPFIDEAEAEALAKGTLLGDYRVAQQRRAAELWPIGKVPPHYFDNVILNSPTLIIQGELDPVVDANWVINRFARGRVLEIPKMGHVPEDSECLLKLMVNFLNSGDFSSLDTACFDGLTLPPFKIGAE